MCRLVARTRAINSADFRRLFEVCCWVLALGAFAIAAQELGAGEASAGMTPPVQDQAAANPTATRAAELAELSALQTEVAALQTQVAQLSATPTATVEPTPVAPSQPGQPLLYGGNWTIVVGAASVRPTIDQHSAKGMFVEIPLTITNGSAETRFVPFGDFVLTDAQGRRFEVDIVALTAVDARAGLPADPWLPTDRRIVFDVATDAGEVFVLESKSDPSFRVEVAIQARG